MTAQRDVPVSTGNHKLGNPLGRITINGVQAGAVMAIMALLASAFVSDRIDEAYGVCMACHGRDLINWLLNHEFQFRLPISSAFIVFPALTTVGVLLGAMMGAVFSGDFRWHCPENFIKSFVLGMLVMIFALIAGGCATRLLLRAATGEALGLIGGGAMMIGVVLASYLLRWWAQR